MTQIDVAPAEASDARLSPEALMALEQDGRAFDDLLAAEELRTAESDEADDEPDEPDELEDDARP
jgi:hypothetical protein